jgi:hypothetical protein
MARYYDPATGSFLSVDPYVAQTLSPYGYVAGDPLNRADPSGMISPGDLSAAQFFGLARDCAGLGSADAAACMAAAFCPDQIACFTTGAQLFGSAESLATEAAGLPTGCTKSQILGQAKELARLAAVAELSADYYSGGGILSHIVAAVLDTPTGIEYGVVVGGGAGCVLTVYIDCYPGAVIGAVVGAPGGALGGFVYGLSTGNVVDAGELFGEIAQDVRDAFPGV